MMKGRGRGRRWGIGATTTRHSAAVARGSTAVRHGGVEVVLRKVSRADSGSCEVVVTWDRRLGLTAAELAAWVRRAQSWAMGFQTTRLWGSGREFKDRTVKKIRTSQSGRKPSDVDAHTVEARFSGGAMDADGASACETPCFVVPSNGQVDHPRLDCCAHRRSRSSG